MAADPSFDRHELVSRFRRQINLMWLVILVLLLLNFIQFSGKGKVAAILVDGTPVAYVEDKDTADGVLASVLDSVKFDTKASDARFSNTVRVVAVSKRNADSLDDQKGAEEKLKRYAKVLVNAFVAQNNQTGERLVALPTVDAVKELQARVSSEAAAKQLPPNLQPLTDITESKQWVDSNLAFATVEQAYAFLSGGKLPATPALDTPTPVAPVPADDNTATTAPVKPAPQPVVSKPVKPATPTVTPAPAPSGGGTYTVKEGDTAWGICKRLKVSLSTLEKLNPGVNLDILKPGDKLNLPGGTN